MEDIDEKIAKIIGVDYPSLIQSELPYYRAIYQAGIREVVEWLEGHLYYGRMFGQSPFDWQTFKKERGIE